MKKIAIAVLCTFLVSSLGTAQTFLGGYAFSLPYYDTTSQKFLPSFPALPLDAHSFIGIDADGHFSHKGEPIRFWGTNIVASGAFPEKKYAAVIAGRLRKMGFNLIRFHHLDNSWGSGTSLFDWQTDTRHLNADRLDRLENLIGELKKNGIYANMNLHVARVFSAKDGVPDADSIAMFGPEMSKGIYYFDPQVKMLNKEYARQLLTHVNPYTGLALAADPVMAMVELTNEDAILRMWKDGKLKPYAMGGDLTIRHTRMLDSLWNGFLKKKYATASAFAQAWNAGAADEGAHNMVRNAGFESSLIDGDWQLEQNTPAVAAGTMSPDNTLPASGSRSAKVVVAMTDGIGWHMQFKQTGLSVVKDSTYVVKFSARSDAARAIDLTVMKNGSPYTGYGWFSPVQLGTGWKTYSFTFAAPATDNGDVRLSFQLGALKGSYWFDDVSMSHSGVMGVPPGGDFDLGTVRRVEYVDCKGSTDQRVRDISEFYLGLTRDCLREMRSFVRDTLGVTVPVSGTNWFADQAEIATQSEMDYIDNHAYWDHPSFPNAPWSPTDWRINNTAMVNGADWSTFPSLTAGVGIMGKPLTISEYNHPYPNRYQVEGPLFLAAYSAFHGVDGIMYFDYNGSSDYHSLDYVNGYFDIHRNTAVMALMPSCAYAYRMGLIAPAKQTMRIDFSARDIELVPKYPGRVLFNKKLALGHGLRASGYTAATTTASLYHNTIAGPYSTDTREILWDTQGMLSVSTPKFAAAAGFFAAMPNRSAGAMSVTTASDFAAITWLSLTVDSLTAARRSVLTLSTRMQNTHQVWDGTQTIHNNWGTGPVLMQPLRAELRLRISADSLRVTTLGMKGEARGAATTVFPSARDRRYFDLLLDQNEDHTVWYGLEAFGAGVSTAAPADEPVPEAFTLEQNYPNPFNPSTVIGYELPKREFVTVTIHDVLGRVVAMPVNEEQTAGSHSFTFSAGRGQISSGVYFYRLRAGTNSAQRTMVILK